MSLVLGGVCDLCSETRGGQYFAAEGREIEGPPLRMFLAASLSIIDLPIFKQKNMCHNIFPLICVTLTTDQCNSLCRGLLSIRGLISLDRAGMQLIWFVYFMVRK